MVVLRSERDLGEIVAVTLHQIVDVAIAHNLVEILILDCSQYVSQSN